MSVAELKQIWDSASASPFQPGVGKSAHFTVGFVLLMLGMHDKPPLFGTGKLTCCSICSFWYLRSQ